MPKLPSISAARAVRALKRAGFIELRQKGSHVSMEKKTPEKVFRTVVPQHPTLAKGTLSDIIRQAGLTLEEFLNFYNRCLAEREITKSLTESNAAAVFRNRCGPNFASSCASRASRSASFAHSTATPRSLSGAAVGVARNSEHDNPRSPGNVVQEI
jgi:predicted RNA binding protein YcfA (HicA-like mRNA interferase family)